MKSKGDDRQAALERENAELRRQLDESLAQQLATAEVLRVINASRGDLKPAFDMILEKAVALGGATFGTFMLREGERFFAGAVHGAVPESFARILREGFVPSPTSPVGRLRAGEPFVHIPDLAAMLPAVADDPVPRTAVEMGGVRTLLMVPLVQDGQLVGLFTNFRREVRPFTDKQITLLQNFAAQAVIAIENARLLTETREALEQQTATAEVLGVINSSPGDLAPVFDTMLDKAMRLCEAAFGILFTLDGESIVARALRNVPAEFSEYLAREPPRVGPGTLLGRTIVERAPLQTADILSSEPYRQGASLSVASADLAHVRTLLVVPLVKDHAVLGLFTVYRTEVRPFADKQIALLQNFAAQAVIAMENARLITETREALEQQTATAEVLGVINASPGDLGPVFDAMLEKAMRLCGAAFGELQTYNGEHFEMAALHGPPPRYAEFRLSRTHVYGPGTIPARLLAGERLIQVLDITAEDAYRDREPNRIALADLGGARTVLAAPLVKDDDFLGFIVVYRQEVRPFGDKQIALLQNFAAQAVIAMENARLITETREALEQQTATAEVLGVINSSPGDLAPVFDTILEKAHRLCDATRGTLFLFDGETFRAAAVHGYPPPAAGTPPRAIKVSEDPRLAALLAGERLIHVPDLTQLDDPIARAVAERGGVRTNLLLPLRKDGTLLGVISCNRHEVQPFSDKDIALLENFAQQAVIAIENARLITETREALDQQTATAEVLGVINSSPGDLAPVFRAMLDRAMRLCEAAYGLMWVADGDVFDIAAWVGVPDAFVQGLPKRFAPAPKGPLGRLLSGEPFVHIDDLRDAVDAMPGAQVSLRGAEAGARTLLAVPLSQGDRVLGVFVIFRREVRAFTDKQIAFLQNFAAQAVIAMENARLITETREALEQQTATAEVLGVINASPGDLAPVFDAMLRKATELCDAAFAVLEILDGELLRVAATYQLPAALTDVLKTPQSAEENSIRGMLLAGAAFVHQPDMLNSEIRIAPVRRAFVELAGSRANLAVALRKENAFLGILWLHRQEPRPFTERQIALMQNFAAQAVIAIENVRLLGELRQRTDEVAELNRGLEARVAEAVDELGRVGNLKRFLPPQVAEMVVSQGDERILESHRREIVVVFCDVRGYTAFSETAEPEEVIEFLSEYHAALGPLITRFEGTLSHFLGDGLMVFFNDPVPCPDPAERAVKMAVAMREAAGSLVAAWRRRGHQMGFGAGIAQGYATLGQIGFADRSDYTAIGTVCNLAARLCGEAQHGQILLARRVAVAVENGFALEELGSLTLKGLTQPVVAFNVVGTAGMAEAASG